MYGQHLYLPRNYSFNLFFTSFFCRPLDFLGLDHDRFAISAIFGASAGSLLKVISNDLFKSSNSGWVRGCIPLNPAASICS